MSGTITRTIELEEVPCVWLGRTYLVDATYTEAGTWSAGCKQTHWSPAEPPCFEVAGDRVIEIARVTDDGDEVKPADVLLAAGIMAGVQAYVTAHLDDWRDAWAAEEAEAAERADEAAYDRHIDHLVDARRERRC